MEVVFTLSLIKRVLEKMFFLLKITCLNIFFVLLQNVMDRGGLLYLLNRIERLWRGDVSFCCFTNHIKLQT